MSMTFRTLVIGETFRLNGNTYIKKSSRTAKMIGLGKLGSYCKTFYIEQLASCEPIEGMWKRNS